VQGLTVEALVDALQECLTADTINRAQTLANRVEVHGAQIAAQHLNAVFA